jgi:hypothetical protein
MHILAISQEKSCDSKAKIERLSVKLRGVAVVLAE